MSSSVRLRELSKLEYGNPSGFLEALAPLDRAASWSDIPDRTKNLRTNKLKSERERRDAAIFCVGMSKAIGVPVHFALTESQDYDFVTTWKVDETQHFAAVQLKELVSTDLNPTSSLNSIFESLARYSDSDDLTVAIKLNRVGRFEPSEIVCPTNLSVGGVWLYGAVAEDQSKWALWGDFRCGPVVEGITYDIPR
jgi:hypothetical protein